MSASMIFVLVILALAIYAGFSTIQIVKQGYEYTVLRLGRFNRVLAPGLHILVPFYETVGERVNMKEQVLDVPRQEVISCPFFRIPGCSRRIGRGSLCFLFL